MKHEGPKNYLYAEVPENGVEGVRIAADGLALLKDALSWPVGMISRIGDRPGHQIRKLLPPPGT